MNSLPIAVFAYAFPHRKTHDFLTELAIGGYTNLCVIAAPWRELKHSDETVYIPARLRAAPAIETSKICGALGIAYHEVAHDDLDAITDLKERYNLKAGLISGARILKRPVVELLEHGIVNFHPGSLPETAGLDLFYHTIRSGAALGVTAHFIDHRVDAGRKIFFEETPIGADDRPEEVLYNNYQTQIRALRRLIANPDWNRLETTTVDRPRKNDPMSGDEKRKVLARFPEWRNALHRAQQAHRLVLACETGACDEVEHIISSVPGLLECRSPQGWTPLIVASFHQQADCVQLLLNAGADPNAAGKNGTTVLMYAKTALINRPTASRAVLDLLITAGADVCRRDAYGYDIAHYLRKSGDVDLTRWFEDKGTWADD